MGVRRWLRRASWIAVLAGGAIVVSRMDLAAVAGAFASASWQWIALAGLLNLAGVVIDACRWRAIVGGAHKVPLLGAIEGLLLGWLSNMILPFKMGEGAKAWSLAQRERLPLPTVLSTVFLDRAADVAGFVVVVLIVSFIAPLPPSALEFRTYGIVAVVGAVIGIVAARRWLIRPGAAALDLESTWGRVAHGFSVLGHQGRLLRVMAWAECAWLVRGAVVWCVVRAFHLDLPVAAAASALITVNLGISVVAMPGNLGVFEMAFAAGLRLWDVPGEVAVGAGLALHAAELVPIIGLALLVRWLAPAVTDEP